MSLRGLGLGELEQPLGDGDPIRAGVVLGSERAQREVELRREQENDERRLVADAAVDEPNADGHRHESDAQCGSELEDGTGEERDAQRPHRRLAVLLARLCDRRRLRFPPVVRAQRR